MTNRERERGEAEEAAGLRGSSRDCPFPSEIGLVAGRRCRGAGGGVCVWGGGIKHVSQRRRDESSVNGRSGICLTFSLNKSGLVVMPKQEKDPRTWEGVTGGSI